MEYVSIGFSIVNTILLIGIAGSVTKLLKYLEGDDKSQEDWGGIIRERRILDPQSRMPNYTETPTPKEQSQNWDGIPITSKNWDGVPSKE